VHPRPKPEPENSLPREVFETFRLSSRIDVPEHPEIYEIERAMTKAPVRKNGRRFEFGELDDSVCGEDDFLALVSWLFPLIPDDTAKKKDMAWAYGDGLAFGHESAAVWLIENGLDLKNVILDEGTALGFAASYKRPSIVRLLLGKGCDPNVFEKNGIPPLFEMIRNQGAPDPERAFLDERAIETARSCLDRVACNILGDKFWKTLATPWEPPRTPCRKMLRQVKKRSRTPLRPLDHLLTPHLMLRLIRPAARHCMSWKDSRTIRRLSKPFLNSASTPTQVLKERLFFKGELHTFQRSQ
jgi:hypothetical protein